MTAFSWISSFTARPLPHPTDIQNGQFNFVKAVNDGFHVAHRAVSPEGKL
jgi:hypothetical protein